MIKITNVCKYYGKGKDKFQALRDINLEIKEGEFVAIMGPSGSGKSTLMNIIGLLDKNFDGSYKLNDVEVKDYNDEKLSLYRNESIGFVFQSFNLLPRLNAFRNIELPLLYGPRISKSERQDRVLKALENVELISHKNNLPKEMSGGQKQRIAIARALVNRPSFILADEPTGALDSKTGKSIMELFVKLHSEGKTIIIVTHDKNIASYADRLITILDGTILKDEVLK
ncbi:MULTISPECIES: ABC transporter ATP-binding protein [Clostridium]|uniref:ABC transporter, ATP-binding protein n=1 Tax=Clostridium novyi (strain NT) TaxID=386415 RepID=A0Q2H3_CLONN|nr:MULTISPECIES: ABC transporter ATP-binding protein [Clostridium]ABK62137.1 ABC transporter, ATP-binding protein [Clostridium novyi NT]KEH85819.1 macrolide ABC transporter ATP-binding protein [Clostridium novyi A str. NCTC 538]KEH87093.1 macrolide ABC transporter ATP-binding protein [Clostridium novyi A str. 4540]KEH88922.1 macrolide ABC transporter ATP-binding protein [Clostridium novyi A str. BKT29909]KEH92535.1 macrolide ABC transporter ATP-binding protein [Clostridium novyi A str. GD21120